MGDLEQFKRDGYTTIESVLSEETIGRLRAGLDPHWAEQTRLGAASPFWDQGHVSERSGVRDGTARVSISNALATIGDGLGLGDLVLEFLLAPPCLDFTQRVLGPDIQLDDYSIAGAPGKAEGHAVPEVDLGSADEATGEALILWHRDSFHSITQFNYFCAPPLVARPPIPP